MSTAAITVLAVALGALLRPRLGAARSAIPESPHLRATRPSSAVWADLLDSTAREVRAGSSLSVAFERATTRHRVHGAAVGPGASLDQALMGASADPDEGVVLHSLTAASLLGGPVAATLQAGVSVLREREAVRAEAQVHSAQARLSARVLTGVPIVFCAWSFASSSAFRAALLTPVGVVAAAVGAVLNGVGWLIMRHIVRSASR
jgi:tight adherence protein B